jgi:BirA family transcriptional regulator, biotin operon repressor / biotin---[acetyl-CoA-carboxylase] ligase
MTETLSWSAAADERRRIGHDVEFHARIGSTNDRAREALAEPGGEGRAIVADLQTSGRGRRGRTWHSPPGVNLMVSVALHPRLAARNAWQLAAAAALAVRDACRPWADLRLKWPNDLLAPDERKVAGLLIETALEGDLVAEAVVGAGINVNWPRSEMPPEIQPGASSLLEVGGTPVDRVALLGRILRALDTEVAWLESGISPLERYREAAVLDGRWATVLAGETAVTGRLAGIGDDGSLLVDTDAGRVAVAYGEIANVAAEAEAPRDSLAAVPQ